jgi:hypothetical protein
MGHYERVHLPVETMIVLPIKGLCVDHEGALKADKSRVKVIHFVLVQLFYVLVLVVMLVVMFEQRKMGSDSKMVVRAEGGLLIPWWHLAGAKRLSWKKIKIPEPNARRCHNSQSRRSFWNVMSMSTPYPSRPDQLLGRAAEDSPLILEFPKYHSKAGRTRIFRRR